MTDTAKIQDHPLYRAAYQAHSGTSHVPEKRAEQEVAAYEATLKDLRELADKGIVTDLDAVTAKYTALKRKQLAAAGRIVSSMIAGPARFPVARMEKYNRWERSAADAVSDFLRKVSTPRGPARTELDYQMQDMDYMVGTVRVRHNTADNRLQLIFPDKPDEAMREKLKSRGFKWSPRNAAWQRQLTPNAVRAGQCVLAKAS